MRAPSPSPLPLPAPPTVGTGAGRQALGRGMPAGRQGGAIPLNVMRFNVFVLVTDYTDTNLIQEQEKSV